MIRKFIFFVLVVSVCFSFNNNIAKSAEYDLDFSGYVDYDDLKIMSGFWLNDCNQDNGWCGNADFDQSGKVNFADYAELAANWQTAPGLIGSWKFDEASGNISSDASGNGNDASLIGGPVKVAWDFGNGVNFNGTDQYVLIDNESFFDITDSITVACWIKKNDNDQTSCLISKSDSFKLYIDQFSRGITFACGGIGRPLSSSTDVCDNKWHHVAGVYDGSMMSIYIDGVLDSSKGAVGQIATNDYKVAIASDDNFSEQKLQGVIDEARIYNQGLSAERIVAIADEYFAAAHYTKPSDNATYQLVDLTLMWNPGRYAVTHDIYFGTDFDAVDNATPDSNEYMGNFIIDANSFSPLDLEYEATYYWRIDEVNDLDD